MLKFFGRLVYRLFNVEVRYLGNIARDNKWLVDYNFNTIVDIGANEGQFAHKMRKLFPGAKIISFEPIPKVHEQLVQSFAGDNQFQSYPYALGEQEEQTVFYVSDYSPSSSLLKMKDHDQHFSHAKQRSSIDVQIKRLDDVLKPEQLKKPLFVKIDVQGFEDKVINGGMELVKDADLILCEVSFERLYEGQKLFGDIYKMLDELGFTFHGTYEQLISPADKKILQADGIFVRKQPRA